jgi:hypothetical protein
MSSSICDINDAECYKLAKEKFVTGHNGTTMYELFLISLIFPISLTLYFTLRKRCHKNPPLFILPYCCNFEFLFEYCTLVVPTTITMTLAADLLIPTMIIILSVSLTYYYLTDEFKPFNLLSCCCFKTGSTDTTDLLHRGTTKKRTDTMIKIGERRAPHVTYFRSGVMLATCCAILAVDFPSFPRYFNVFFTCVVCSFSLFFILYF